MAIAIFPKRFTMKPPVGTQINWAHPLSKDLVGCWLFNEGAGSQFNDLTETSPPGALTSDVFGSSILGIALNCPGISGVQKAVARTTGLIGGSPNFTIVASYATAASAISGGRSIYAERSASGLDIVKLDSLSSDPGAGINATGPFITLRDDSGTLLFVGTSSVSNDGKSHQAAAVKNGGAISLYVDGSINATGTWSGTNNFTDANQTWISADPNTAAGTAVFSGSLGYVYVFRRALSQQEVQQLYQDPYCFLQAQSPSIRLVIAPAAGGSTFSVSVSYGIATAEISSALVSLLASSQFAATMNEAAAGTLNINTAEQIAATLGFSDAGGFSYNASASLAITLAQVTAYALSVFRSSTFAIGTSCSTQSVLNAAALVSLGLVSGFSLANTLIANEAAQISATASATAISAALINELTSLGITTSTAAAAGKVISAAIALGIVAALRADLVIGTLQIAELVAEAIAVIQMLCAENASVDTALLAEIIANKV